MEKGGVDLESFLTDAVRSMGEEEEEEQEEEEERGAAGKLLCFIGMRGSCLSVRESIFLVPSARLISCSATDEGRESGMGQWFCAMGTGNPALRGKRRDIFVVWPTSAGLLSSPILFPFSCLLFICSLSLTPDPTRKGTARLQFAASDRRLAPPESRWETRDVYT